MSNPISNPPTLEGFIAWSRAVMGLSTIVIPDDAPGYNYAFYIALDWVPYFSSSACCYPFMTIDSNQSDPYTLCVYNWAGSQLIQFQQDIPGQTFFTDARQAYGVNNFVAGVIDSANDVSTGEHLSVGQGLQNLQLIDLQRLKDPYGRQALAIMQSSGTLWGLT